MAESDAAIANRALQKLGATSRISSLDQDSPNARAMKTAFVPVRDALLREYDWNFAIKRASIAADSTDELYEGLKRYPKPNDFIRLLREKFTTGTNDRQDWQIEGGFILTLDGSPLQFRYIARITDPQQFDPAFDELLAAKLALETVDDITDSTTKPDRLERYVNTALATARRVNAFENKADELQEDDWIIAMR